MSTIAPEPQIDVRRADDRFKTNFGWLDSKHSFSFGHHYDPANTHHGLLLVNNDDIVDARHRLRDPPAPRHGDRHLGAAGLAGAPGLHRPQRRHLPRPGPADERRHRHPALREERLLAPRRATQHRDPVHFVQMWVVPDEGGITPGYEQLEIDDELLARRARPGRLRHGASTTAPPRSGSRTSTPPCTPPGSSPARPSSCPRRRSCTCSCRAAPSTWRAPARSAPATPSGSPPPAASGSPRPSRPRSWSGRCTPTVA